MAQQGSAGNVIAALCSFFYPRTWTTGSGTLTNGDHSVCYGCVALDHLAGLDNSPLVDSGRSHV
jgi:hypothetical protein